MGNVNWVILGFRSEKCTQFFLGPRTSNFGPHYGDFLYKMPQKAICPLLFLYFLVASAAKKCEKKQKKNVIQSAAIARPRSAKGGCASSRLDHGFKFYVSPRGCASSRLISDFSDCGALSSGLIPVMLVLDFASHVDSGWPVVVASMFPVSFACSL